MYLRSSKFVGRLGFHVYLHPILFLICFTREFTSEFFVSVRFINSFMCVYASFNSVSSILLRFYVYIRPTQFRFSVLYLLSVYLRPS